MWQLYARLLHVSGTIEIRDCNNHPHHHHHHHGCFLRRPSGRRIDHLSDWYYFVTCLLWCFTVVLHLSAVYVFLLCGFYHFHGAARRVCAAQKQMDGACLVPSFLGACKGVKCHLNILEVSGLAWLLARDFTRRGASGVAAAQRTLVDFQLFFFFFFSVVFFWLKIRTHVRLKFLLQRISP